MPILRVRKESVPLVRTSTIRSRTQQSLLARKDQQVRKTKYYEPAMQTGKLIRGRGTNERIGMVRGRGRPLVSSESRFRASSSLGPQASRLPRCGESIFE